MATKRPIAWTPLIAAMVSGAVLAGMIAWRFHLRSVEEGIDAARDQLKRAMLSGRTVAPDINVTSYLLSRAALLKQRYDKLLDIVTVPPLDGAATTDPQLYFREQLHEVQRTLKRLAAARSLPVPEQLGFPKELPPSDAVPRLLVQLALISDLAELIFEQGVGELTSFKIEDPQTVANAEGAETFLMRLPVRVRLTVSLPQMLKILGAIQGVSPVVDVSALRIASSAEADGLNIDLLLARYLMTAQGKEPADSNALADRPVGRSERSDKTRRLRSEKRGSRSR